MRIDLNKAAFNYNKDFDYDMKFQRERPGFVLFPWRSQFSTINWAPRATSNSYSWSYSEISTCFIAYSEIQFMLWNGIVWATNIVKYDNFGPTFKVQGRISLDWFTSPKTRRKSTVFANTHRQNNICQVQLVSTKNSDWQTQVFRKRGRLLGSHYPPGPWKKTKERQIYY